MIDRYFFVSVASVMVAILMAMVIVIFRDILPQRLPLFYSLAWGEQQLASLQQLFIVPAIITIISLINLVIAWQLHPSQFFLKKILVYSSLITDAILLITFIKIIFIFF